jgi:hypothetical protein
VAARLARLRPPNVDTEMSGYLCGSGLSGLQTDDILAAVLDKLHDPNLRLCIGLEVPLRSASRRWRPASTLVGSLCSHQCDWNKGGEKLLSRLTGKHD